MKLKRPHLAGLLLIFLTAGGLTLLRAALQRDVQTDRIQAVSASISELAQSPAQSPAQLPVRALRPNREGESSRIDSSYTEEEIAELIDRAKLFPPDPKVDRFDDGPAGVDFTAGRSFDSMDISECCADGILNPPDPEIAVGEHFVVATVNAAVEVYDKTGSSLVGPIPLQTFFQSLGQGCTIFPFDPNVIYDEADDRYIIAADGDETDYCVAVSQGNDATGDFNFYAFPVNVDGDRFDYPHIGVGDDAIYVGANMFGVFEGRIFAFEKETMYAGQPATSVTHFLGFHSTPQPMKIRGAPPANGKHYFITSGGGHGIFQLFSWRDPFGANILIDEGSLDLAAVHGVKVGFGVGSPQLGGIPLNSIDPRGLDFEYRNGSGWLTSMVSCNPGGGTVNCVQWAQIDVATATVTQAGVFGTDDEYRIFPDLAVNVCGDMLVGYTKTSFTSHPGIWVAGRQAQDPPGTMQGEIGIKAGEIPFSTGRWGDYTSMTVDPDGVTLWYIGEYSKNISTQPNWGTHIGRVTFDSCASDSLFLDGFEWGNTARWNNVRP